MTLSRTATHRFLGLALGAGVLALLACDAPQLEVHLRYDEGASTLLIGLSRPLQSGEQLRVGLRQGDPGTLDCASRPSHLEPVETHAAAAPDLGVEVFEGPRVDPAYFEDTVYDTRWLEGEPTAEMLAAAEKGEWLVDLCVMRGDAVVQQAEMDLKRALDRKGVDGKADGEGSRIVSTVAYAEACVEALGEIPFFEPLGDGDYTTYDCLDSTPIPTTVTGPDGVVEYPETQVIACDNPQYIYSLCEPNAVSGRTNGPRVASRSNAQGTHWVLLCRKAKTEEGQYNDIAMIGHNPYTGKTCFFQNALYSRTDGRHVPHPADKVQSEASPQQSNSLWRGIHGGLGSGIQCADCHDADPFIHSPWIDGAVDENGDPIVPKMGIDDDFALGFNDSPYTIVNARGQGWTMPRQLVDDEAAACTRCHRIGSGRWAREWVRRLNGTDARWDRIVTEAYKRFEHRYWMPPDLEGLDEATFGESEYAKAMERILHCGSNPSDCDWLDLPTEPVSEPGEAVTIDLEGTALAMEAAKVLGAEVRDPADPRCTGPEGSCATRRCAECHSVSKNGLRDWLDLTRNAWSECGLDRDPKSLTEAEARAAIDCMRTDPNDPETPFAAAKLGVLAAGVQYGPFRDLFRKAYGDDWLPRYMRFKARVSMPKGNHPKLSQKEFATVVKWMERGLNDLDTVIEEPPPPTACQPFIDAAALSAHAETMRYEGWGAVNAEAGIRMFGCEGRDPTACFSGMPERPEWARNGRLVELTRLSFRSSFWTRSSADGRFVGNGGGPSGATITDLLTGRDIGVDASYDPGFFPDNSGFIFQGGGAGICTQSVLERDDHIDFDEPECIRAAGINLYQHTARGLSGDYFIINSQFTSDAGRGSSDPRANFGPTSTMKFTPMIFNGSTYEPQKAIIVDSPYEGDSVLSPSAQLVVSRLAGPDGTSLGYVVRRVRVQRYGDRYAIDIGQKLAEICVSGAKPNISFDERFFVTHHYENGTSNILLVDLLTGESHQVTEMPSNARALYPHFRSDGWFYFLVKTDAGEEYVLASDAALKLAQAGGGSGGSGGSARAPRAHGELVIDEILYDPSGLADNLGEWFELYNPTSDPLTLAGCVLAGKSRSEVLGDLVVPPRGYVTFARSQEVSFTPDALFGVPLTNTGGSISITCGGITIDEVAYGGGGFPSLSGRALSLDPMWQDADRNDVGEYWCDGGLGTPGAPNPPCN
ncbi:MAG: lamin tail domain-containing protein [Deltaproteobacteria bacterium]|nr:MAG: lamin tail domain-containing protein [Deltaproteobacteria bacterium]